MSIRRLLVIRGGAVGDLIVTLPVFGALRRAFPQACIDVLGHPSRAILARHHRYANRVIDVESGAWYRLFSAQASASEALAEYLHTCDAIIAYLPQTDSVLAQNLRQYCPGPILTWSSHAAAGVHSTTYLLQAVSALCPQGYDPCPRVYLEADAMAAAERFWRQANLPDAGVVALHPGSGGQRKLWPVAGWQRVMQWMAAQGWRGIVIQGPAEQERDLRLLQANSAPDWTWVCNLPLPHLAALMARCQVVLSHDSGIAHLAAAVGTTTLALFGPTDPWVWGPRHPRACVLQPSPPQVLSLENLTPDMVMHTLQALWQGTFVFDPAPAPCTIVSSAGI